VPIILVGNKKDLRNDPQTMHDLSRNKQETVKTEQGKAIAEQIGLFKFTTILSLNAFFQVLLHTSNAVPRPKRLKILINCTKNR
jgi:hypothetical protein